LIDNINISEILNKILEKDDFTNNQTSNYPKLLSEFIAKTLKNLDLIETNIIMLEKDLHNHEILNNIFCSFHEIKSSSGFIGQRTIRKIVHQTERLIETYKDSSTANKNIVVILHISIDYIREICANTSLCNDENFLNTVFIHLKNIYTLINKDHIDSGQLIKDKKYIIEKINNELLKEFELEIKEELKTIEDKTPKLVEDSDKEILNSVFLAVRTITRQAERSGYVLIRRIAFQAEMLLESCCKDEITVSSDIIKLILASRNYINSICNNFDLTVDSEFLNDIYHHLEKMNTSNFQKEIINAKEILIDKEYWQDFIAETNEHLEIIEMNVLILERDNNNIQVINTMYRSFHSIKGLAGFVNQSLIQEISHKTETIMTDCLRGNLTVNSDVADLILSSADCIKQICSDITLNRNYSFLKTINDHLKLLENIQFNLVKNESDSAVTSKNGETNKKIGEILIDQNTLSSQEVDEILRKQKEEYSDLTFGQIVLKEHKAKPREILNAIRKQHIHKAAMTQDEFMRVPVNKIDNLVEIIGELIATQSAVKQESSNFTTTDLFRDNINKLSKITKDLENISIFLRIVPLKSTFQKLARIARDAMIDLNKDINFIIQGEDTEIDRNIAEKMLVPLVHMLRNAISHGIEDKEEREKLNKTPQGTVIVSSHYTQGKFYIKVSDDGKGIDVDKIYKKALEQSLINSERDYSENEIIDLIFLPGFSSADSVNNISGRGIGLDVVKAEVEKIGGKISINSKISEGCSFILEMPVKNVIMNGITVDIKESNYFIPSTFIRQIIKPQEQDWICVENEKNMVRLEGELVPIVYAFESQISDYKDDNTLIILLEIDQKLLALPITKILERRKVEMSVLENEKTLLVSDIDDLFIA